MCSIGYGFTWGSHRRPCRILISFPALFEAKALLPAQHKHKSSPNDLQCLSSTHSRLGWCRIRGGIKRAIELRFCMQQISHFKLNPSKNACLPSLQYYACCTNISKLACILDFQLFFCFTSKISKMGKKWLNEWTVNTLRHWLAFFFALEKKLRRIVLL